MSSFRDNISIRRVVKRQLSKSAVDADKNGVISSLDRRTRTTRSVVAGPLNRTVVERGTSAGYEIVSTTNISPNGRYQKTTEFGLETTTNSVFDGDGIQTTTTTYPDNSSTVQISTQGRLDSTTQRDANGVVIGSTALQYDAHGRLWKSTDGRLNTGTTYGYNDADQIASVDVGGQSTGYEPDALGRVLTETLPGPGRVISRTYWGTGELRTESGSAGVSTGHKPSPIGGKACVG